MFENFKLSDVVTEIKNPLKEQAELKRKQAFENIKNFIDERLREERSFYIEENGENYAEAMRKDKVPAAICESKELVKLMAEYMEWSI